jgi:hypothetical protein
MIMDEFTWGKVVKTHQIGEYTIIEFHPKQYRRGVFKGEYAWHTEYHPYIGKNDTNRSFESLDMALIGAIFYKREGPNAQGPDYVRRMLPEE